MGPEDDLPKGMQIERPEAPARPPAPLTLAEGNYAGAIRTMLRHLPVNVRVDRLVAIERDGLPPVVNLTLTILGEKEG